MSSRSASDRGTPRVLVYGYGNPGRQDDGAGVVFVEELAAWAQSGDRPWISFDNNYQLNIEDALAVAQHEVVIFADASRDQSEGFLFRSLTPCASLSFTTHAMTPESVVALSRELYGACPDAYLLTFRGYAWEPNGLMTSATRGHLEAGKAFITRFLDRRGAGSC
jgi:hydrogenase maturation protease